MWGIKGSRIGCFGFYYFFSLYNVKKICVWYYIYNQKVKYNYGIGSSGEYLEY